MGRKLGLSTADVAETAARIADTEGLEGVTLASVAAELGIRSPSLYAHVAGLAGLRRLLALRAARILSVALGAAAEGRTGAEALRAVACAYRRFAQDHAGLYDAAQWAARPGEDDELYRTMAGVVLPLVRALGEAGVPAEERVHLARAFRSALHGFVALEQAEGFGQPESVDDSFHRLVELLISGVQEAVPVGSGGG